MRPEPGRPALCHLSEDPALRDLRLLGIHHKELQGTASFVVRRMVCDFLKPATIDDVLDVETRFIAFSGARMELTQHVMRSGDKIFEAQVTVAFVDASGKPRRIPESMIEALNSI